MTPSTFTSKVEIVSPTITVFAIPSIPVVTSLTGIKSIACAVVSEVQKKSASIAFLYRRQE